MVSRQTSYEVLVQGACALESPYGSTVEDRYTIRWYGAMLYGRAKVTAKFSPNELDTRT